MSITNVAIYVRVSTDRQAKKGDSIDEQLSTCKNYIASKENMVLAGVYIDDGISGRKIKRGDFEQLLDDVRLGRVDLIIFTKLDRWFRSLRHYLNTQAILEANHCDWLAVDQPYFDTTTPHGRAFVAQSMTFAELEAENDSVRIRDVFDYKYRQGEVLSGKVPLGYSIENKHLVPNQDADNVLHIFQFYAECGSLNQTITHLESDMGIIMSQDNLKKSILKNKKYIGVFRDNDHYCPAIIPADLFDRVQELLLPLMSKAARNTVTCLVACFAALTVVKHSPDLHKKQRKKPVVFTNIRTTNVMGLILISVVSTVRWFPNHI